MKQSRSIMGMPITVEIIGASYDGPIFARVFEYFTEVDRRFSTYKHDSEISRLNRGEIDEEEYSSDMQEVFALAEQTKKETNGFFDVTKPDDAIDPSGIVKGWAIHNAARLIASHGFDHFYVEAGGDIEVSGHNAEGSPWRVGVRNPFNLSEHVKVLALSNRGVATSGNYERGAHIYVPQSGEAADAVASITVVGPDALEADRFATAAFAMGEEGVKFIEKLPSLEAYQIGKDAVATMTSGFTQYVAE